MKNDRSLLTFPILSVIFAILAAVAIWAPTAIISGVLAGEPIDDNDPLYYLAGAATAYVSTFIALFFNVALAACAARSLRGEDTKVGDGVSAAAHRIVPIVGWSLVAATVGLILRWLEERAPALGRIAVWIAGAAWAIATFFVVPVIALEGSGPWRSLKRSVAIVKQRWGEGATGTVAISVVTALVVVAIVLVGGGCAFALYATGQQPLAIAVAAVGVAAIIVVTIMSSALTGIFRVAVYQYAVTGETPGGFDAGLLQTAFEGQSRRR
ncbi:MAG TPA: DUF6159 family protein [Mycobacterium sp.]|nr:DUF6159 family protein [Mycobacterium sp.]